MPAQHRAGGMAQPGEMPRHVQHLAVTPACIRLDTHPVSHTPPPCSPRGAADVHVPVCKPTATGAHSPVSAAACLSCPRTSMCTRIHAQNPARSCNTCLPSSCSAHASPRPPAQPGSGASASPHVCVPGQTLTSRHLLTGTCLCSSSDLSVACLSDGEGKGQENLRLQREAAHFCGSRQDQAAVGQSHHTNVMCDATGILHFSLRRCEI